MAAPNLDDVLIQTKTNYLYIRQPTHPAFTSESLTHNTLVCFLLLSRRSLLIQSDGIRGGRRGGSHGGAELPPGGFPLPRARQLHSVSLILSPPFLLDDGSCVLFDCRAICSCFEVIVVLVEGLVC